MSNAGIIEAIGQAKAAALLLNEVQKAVRLERAVGAVAMSIEDVATMESAVTKAQVEIIGMRSLLQKIADRETAKARKTGDAA
jgi:hypothetical protein